MTHGDTGKRVADILVYDCDGQAVYCSCAERVLTPSDIPLLIKFSVHSGSNPQNEPVFVVVSNKFLEDQLLEDQARRDSLLSAANEKLHRRVYQMKAMVSLEVDQLVLENRCLFPLCFLFFLSFFSFKPRLLSQRAQKSRCQVTLRNGSASQCDGSLNLFSLFNSVTKNIIFRQIQEAAKAESEALIQKNSEVLETTDRLARNPELDADDAIVTSAPIYDQ